MRRSSRAVTAGLVATLLCGCAGLLSIPDEVGRAHADGGPGSGDEGGGGPDGAVDGETSETSMPADGGSDAPVDGGDAAVPPACDPLKDFGAPSPISSLNTAEDEGSPRLTEDELTVFFDAKRGAAKFDLYTAKRTSLAAPFAAPAPIAGSVNSIDADEYSPSVTPNGLQIFFERQDATGVSRLMTSTRVAVSGPFGAAVALAALDSNSYTANPYVRGNGSEIFYVSDTGLLTPINMYVGKQKADGTYQGSLLANVNVNDVNIEPSAPVVSRDRLSLFFASDKAAAFKGTNIYTATRALVSADFGAPSLVANVNTDSDEKPTWVSGDGCRLYLVSTRPGAPGGGKQDMFVATRPR